MSVSKEQWLVDMTENFGVEPEDVLEVAAMFFEAIDDRLAKIARAYEAKDMNELNRLAHGLKGDAANMSFPNVSQLARELEVLPRRFRDDVSKRLGRRGDRGAERAWRCSPTVAQLRACCCATIRA